MTVTEEVSPQLQPDPARRRPRLVRWTIIIGFVVVLEVTTRTGLIDRSLMVPQSEILERLVSIVPTGEFEWRNARTKSPEQITGETPWLLALPLKNTSVYEQISRQKAWAAGPVSGSDQRCWSST
ncbi:MULTISPECIES: hypothetical protein [Mycobacteriales]|uniref:hypothetical protein n=1 Tax=Mycobacteriales TaxID=85007 RepID=UPI003017028B